MDVPIQTGQVISGSLFNEPMRVETIQVTGNDSWMFGLVGLQTEQFRRVSLTRKDLENLKVIESRLTFQRDGKLLRIGLQAYALGISYEFDPYFGLSISKVDPLPHQLEAVYDYLLKAARVRFLLADDAGAGKTIMAGLLIRELRLRGLAERVLIVCPANLAFQWQRELKEKFDEKFVVLKGYDIRDQFGMNQWLEQNNVLTSLDLAKRSEILPGLKQVHWDLVIVDEAHRMSWSPPARKTARYALGELLRQVCNILFNYDIPWNPNRLEQRMGRIHRYGQRKDCLIFNFVATNTIEGRVLHRLLEKLQEIRNALDDDAVFNVVGEVLPSAHVERILRDYYSGKLGDADLEERLLRNVDEGQFRAICQNALEGLATKKLNLEMLVERRARAQERRVVPETIARFVREAAEYVPLPLKTISGLAHTFEPGRTPPVLRRYEQDPDWKLPSLANRYPRCSTDRDTAEENHLEWVTPGHPLFEAVRRHASTQALESFSKGACFYSIQHESPSRIDFFRARIVDGLGNTVHERLFALEIGEKGDPAQREPSILGNFIPGQAPKELPPVVSRDEPGDWLHQHALDPFLRETGEERAAEIDRIAEHIDLSLTELLHRADEEIGRAAAEVEEKVAGAEGRLAQAEARHEELLHRRERRREELERQRSVSLQAVERIASALILPHPDRDAPEVRRLQPNLQTEAVAMQVVIESERNQGRQVFDVHEKNLGYDITSLDLNSGELRLIEVKGLSESSGTILLTPNERRVAEDRRDCYWLYVVTDCASTPCLQEPVRDPARLEWHEVKKVAHYWLKVESLPGCDEAQGGARSMEIKEGSGLYEEKKTQG
ncbi:MAG: DUF3883 domain-containing protein [Thermodesulfobacteriota bacterium]